jgi:hypothetical protein
MPKAPLCKKRPCRICRRWFMPNPRVKDRQKTCADARCKRAWHRKKCAQWNRNNPDYFKANYLQKKLDDASAKTPGPQSRMNSGLPLHYVQEVIGIQHLIIIEYLAQLLLQRFQEVLQGQLVVMTSKIEQLPPSVFSRSDRL